MANTITQMVGSSIWWDVVTPDRRRFGALWFGNADEAIELLPDEPRAGGEPLGTFETFEDLEAADLSVYPYVFPDYFVFSS